MMDKEAEMTVSPDVPVVQRRNAERTRAELLEVATEVFADKGFSGTRIDDIVERTRTTKRMIYYYYGSKENIYLAVLERAYQSIRGAEQELNVEGLDPVDALRKLAELTYDHHLDNSDLIRLFAIENIHRGEFVRRLESVRELNKPALGLLDDILARGRAEGCFKRDVDSLDVHMLISAFSVFQVANNYTFGYLFDVDMTSEPAHDHQKKVIGDVVVSWLMSET